MERAIKNWWLWVVIGVLYVVLSGFLFIQPAMSFIVLSQFMVAFFFVTGFFEIFYSLTNRQVNGWGFNLVMGVLQVFIGGYLIQHSAQGLPEQFMIFLFMFWLIFYGISAISLAFALKKKNVSSWWLTLIVGIIGLVVGLGIPYAPVSGIVFITSLLGAFALMIGLYSIFFGFAIRRHRS